MKFIRFFTNSAGILLLALATAIFIGNWVGAGQVQPREPVFTISMRTLFWIVGAFELSIALICLLGERIWWKAIMILWLTLNLFVYQIGLLWTGNHRSPGVYWGSVANAFGISSNLVFLIHELVSLYLLIGSSIVLLWLWRENSKGYWKAVCAHCGGHVAFLPAVLGQRIACPHCQSDITLRKPDENLTMTCVLCGGHIEFPSHAIGQKIQCPHCAKTITLLQPA